MKKSFVVCLILVTCAFLVITSTACAPVNPASTEDQLAKGPDLSQDKGYGNSSALEAGSRNCSKAFLEDQSKLKENFSDFRSENDRAKKKALTQLAKKYLEHLTHKYTEIVCTWTDENKSIQVHDTQRDYAEALKDIEQNLAVL